MTGENGSPVTPDWMSPYGICPDCHERKFIGHGPLCGDCYVARRDSHIERGTN